MNSVALLAIGPPRPFQRLRGISLKQRADCIGSELDTVFVAMLNLAEQVAIKLGVTRCDNPHDVGYWYAAF